MATGVDYLFYPSEEGSAGNGGRCRLLIEDTWDSDAGTSNVRIRIQVLSAYAGNWQVNGSLSVEGEQKLGNNALINSNRANVWENAWTTTLPQIKHDSSGKAKVKLTLYRNSYSQFTLINYSNPTVYITLQTINGKEFEIELHKNDSGSRVLINGEEYDIVIGNGSGWDKYDAVIGNGTAWENY